MWRPRPAPATVHGGVVAAALKRREQLDVVGEADALVGHLDLDVFGRLLASEADRAAVRGST